jgi:hypothetical protein
VLALSGMDRTEMQIRSNLDHRYCVLPYRSFGCTGLYGSLEAYSTTRLECLANCTMIGASRSRRRTLIFVRYAGAVSRGVKPLPKLLYEIFLTPRYLPHSPTNSRFSALWTIAALCSAPAKIARCIDLI